MTRRTWIVAVAAVVTGLVVWFAATAFAQGGASGSAKPARTIAVSSTATVKAQPDEAVVDLGARSESADSTEAFARNAKDMQRAREVGDSGRRQTIGPIKPLAILSAVCACCEATGRRCHQPRYQERQNARKGRPPVPFHDSSFLLGHQMLFPGSLPVCGGEVMRSESASPSTHRRTVSRMDARTARARISVKPASSAKAMPYTLYHFPRSQLRALVSGGKRHPLLVSLSMETDTLGSVQRSLSRPMSARSGTPIMQIPQRAQREGRVESRARRQP
jgi:Protein of unknown function (DUF541)